jgi:hypothetical protein
MPWCNAFCGRTLRGVGDPVMTAQNTHSGVVMMNHVGISVPNIAEPVRYYTQKMGCREAFRVNDDTGQPRLVYMQIRKNTFLELACGPMHMCAARALSTRSPIPMGATKLCSMFPERFQMADCLRNVAENTEGQPHSLRVSLQQFREQ